MLEICISLQVNNFFEIGVAFDPYYLLVFSMTIGTWTQGLYSLFATQYPEMVTAS